MAPTLLAAWTLAATLLAPADGPAPFALRDGQRVVFLGDSITYAGMYVQHLDAYLATRSPDRRFELLDLGLPSETVSGLSEPHHPYPRPNVHERLARVLEATRPDVVVACYGMNDGIYHPFEPSRLDAYRAGIERLEAAVRAAGATFFLLTPPPFDPRPLRDRLAPEGAADYGYKTPYADYDATLDRYAEWLRKRTAPGTTLVDARASVRRLLDQFRERDEGFVLAGDGVHMGATGHWALASALLEAWHAPAEVDAAEIDAAKRAAVRGKVEAIATDGGTVAFTWTTRIPMPRDPRWDERLVDLDQIAERFNRHRLVVTGLPARHYELREGDTAVGEATREELAGGLDLLRFEDLSTNRRASELWGRVEARERILAGAWLDAAGHKRPDTPRGLPLDEARAKAKGLEAEIRRLAEPQPIALRLVPKP